MEPARIIRTQGRLILTQSERGFWWSLNSLAQPWYWNPISARFTAVCHFSPTERAASAGLEWTLAHEKAGDLDEQAAVRIF